MLQTPATLDDVVITHELSLRPVGFRSLEAENEAFARIARVFARSPAGLLHGLTDAAVALCRAGTCGVSFLEPETDGDGVFRWVALSGALQAYEGGSTPAHFSPCGVCLEHDAPQLFKYPGRYFSSLRDASPSIVEGLVLPFRGRHETLGTLWIVSHDESTHFTQSDVTIMSALADFTAAALDVLEDERRTRVLMEQEREARQEADAANRLKDEFLATVSHELRTPLNAVLGWSELLAAGDLDPRDAHNAATGIHNNALRQARLVDDLIDASRMATGALEMRLLPFDVHALAMSTLDGMRSRAAIAGLRVQTTVGAGDARIRGDDGRWQQALANVIENAIKFTPHGGLIGVDLSVDDTHVRIVITDTGIGIAKEFLPHVFDRFSQSDTSARRRYGGLGLGLTIAHQIVTQHGGTIAVHSDGAGRGTTFTITQPRAAADSQRRDAPVLVRIAEALPRLDDIRVLVVDDDQDAREVITLMLVRQGAKVRTAATVDEAVEILSADAFDVMLGDIAMPSEDGYSLIGRVRGGEGGHRGVAAAALTARASSADQAKSLAKGFDLHLCKPISANALVWSVAALAGRREGIAERRRMQKFG